MSEQLVSFEPEMAHNHDVDIWRHYLQTCNIGFMVWKGLSRDRDTEKPKLRQCRIETV
jgi:hypothetical protein